MRRLFALILVVGLVGCSHLPWKNKSVTTVANDMLSVWARVEADPGLTGVEKENLQKSLAVAKNEIDEAKRLGSSFNPPVDKIKQLLDDAEARVFAAKVYIDGE